MPITGHEIRRTLAPFGAAQQLWDGVEAAFHPICFGIDGTVSSYNLHLRWTGKNREVRSGMRPTICLATGTARVAAALTHELLHMELAHIGYPRLIQNSVNDDERNRINSILNIVDHALMLPRFVNFGFPKSDFLSSDVQNGELVSRCIIYFSKVEEFHEPTSYTTKLCTFLALEGIGQNAWFAKFDGNNWIEIDDWFR